MLWRRLDLDGSGEATLCGFGVLSGWCLETAVRLDCYIYIYNGHLYLLINYWKITYYMWNTHGKSLDILIELVILMEISLNYLVIIPVIVI
jgi:hypothetical protein